MSSIIINHIKNGHTGNTEIQRVTKTIIKLLGHDVLSVSIARYHIHDNCMRWIHVYHKYMWLTAGYN